MGGEISSVMEHWLFCSWCFLSARVLMLQQKLGENFPCFNLHHWFTCVEFFCFVPYYYYLTDVNLHDASEFIAPSMFWYWLIFVSCSGSIQTKSLHSSVCKLRKFDRNVCLFLQVLFCRIISVGFILLSLHEISHKMYQLFNMTIWFSVSGFCKHILFYMKVKVISI